MTPDAPQVSQPTIRLGTNASNQIIQRHAPRRCTNEVTGKRCAWSSRKTTEQAHGHAGVGVDGRLIPDGICCHTRLQRLSSDNAVDYEVVFGDGRIANASVTMVEDLFGVLNDSGSALGLVTCSDKRLLP
ncbi:hypothetical protein HYQ46_009943 [Verticillium longisporum]|nr:hypothetical protein HYQ44_006857 [Verticillium longisporum]KAG7130460.1 hypothetical protein HYQ46_009943 [Verticillium longisporum]